MRKTQKSIRRLLTAKSGAALIWVMVVLIVLTILVAIGLVLSTRSVNSQASRQIESQAYYYASSLNRAVAERLQGAAIQQEEGGAWTAKNDGGSFLLGLAGAYETAIPLPEGDGECALTIRREADDTLSIQTELTYGGMHAAVYSELPYRLRVDRDGGGEYQTLSWTDGVLPDDPAADGTVGESGKDAALQVHRYTYHYADGAERRISNVLLEGLLDKNIEITAKSPDDILYIALDGTAGGTPLRLLALTGDYPSVVFYTTPSNMGDIYVGGYTSGSIYDASRPADIEDAVFYIKQGSGSFHLQENSSFTYCEVYAATGAVIEGRLTDTKVIAGGTLPVRVDGAALGCRFIVEPGATMVIGGEADLTGAGIRVRAGGTLRIENGARIAGEIIVDNSKFRPAGDTGAYVEYGTGGAVVFEGGATILGDIVLQGTALPDDGDALLPATLTNAGGAFVGITGVKNPMLGGIHALGTAEGSVYGFAEGYHESCLCYGGYPAAGPDILTGRWGAPQYGGAGN